MGGAMPKIFIANANGQILESNEYLPNGAFGVHQLQGMAENDSGGMAK